MSVILKITKPENCLLGIALPVTKEDFYNGLNLKSSKDYAKSRQRKYNWEPSALWEIDHLPIVKLMLGLEKELSILGCKIAFNFKLDDLSDINKYDVVTIVSHWNNSSKSVEFFDGMFGMLEVVEKIPHNFRGIFDLTICNSTFLQDEIKKQRKNSLVIANKNPAHLEFRLLFYKTVIKMLYHSELNYIDAVTDLRIEFIKKQNKINYDKSSSNFKNLFGFIKNVR